jgi:hypothetical protein
MEADIMAALQQLIESCEKLLNTFEGQFKGAIVLIGRRMALHRLV